MRIATVSASSYKCYQWCEWKWFLTYGLGFRDESGPAAILGNIAHSYLEMLSLASIESREQGKNMFPDEDELWNTCYAYYSKKSPSVVGQIPKPKLKSVCKGLHSLCESEYSPYSNKTISAEQRFSIEVKDPIFLLDYDKEPKYITLNGFIDRVDKVNEDTVEIIDYKTGTRIDFESKDRKKKDSHMLHEDIQARMYHLAARELYPWAKNFLVTFIYITDGGPVPSFFTEEDIPETLNRIKNRIIAIKENKDPQKNITWKCKNMCWFGKTGMCNSLWNEKEEVGMKTIETKYRILNGKY